MNKDTFTVRHYDGDGHMIDTTCSLLSEAEAIEWADRVYATKDVGFSNQVEVFRDGHRLEVIRHQTIKEYI